MTKSYLNSQKWFGGYRNKLLQKMALFSAPALRTLLSAALFLLLGLWGGGLSAQTPPTKQWDFRFGSVSNDDLYSLRQTADGGYILGGSSTSNAGGDKSEGLRGNTDFWVVKIDGNGTKQWDKRFGGGGHDVLYSLQQTADGGYILGGYSASGADGDKTEGTRGSADYWVVKIDENGIKEWDKRFGGTFPDQLRSLQQTADGGYILGGYSNSGANGDKTEASRGVADYWVVKIDENGTKVWDKRFGGSGTDELYSLQQTADGGYILGGYSNSDAGGDKTDGSRGDNDYWVVKIDENGIKEWDKRFGGSDNDQLYSLQQTADGGYILGGHSNSGAGSDKTEASQGLLDYWVVKIDENGIKEWDKRFGGSGTDQLRSLQQTADGGYLLGGYSNSSQTGDKTEGSRGATDYWVVKLTFRSVWTGAVSIAWNDPANWLPTAIPTATDSVIIPDVSLASGNFPAINAAASVKSLTIQNGATVTIPANQSLTVNNVLTNNGTVTVQSGGSLVQTTGSTLAGTGTYNVQRSKPAGTSFIGSPINNETANGFGITPTGTNGGQVKPSPTNPCNKDSVAHNSPYGNLLEIRENATVLNNCAQSLWHVKSAGNLENGRGYSLSSPATTLNFSGTVNNGTVTYANLGRQAGNIDDSDDSNPEMGWHLVSNPYPSPITLTGSDLTALGFEAQIQRYNAGTWVSDDPLGSATIAVGQGFQIHKASVGGTADFVLNNSFRTAANPTFYKTEPREHYLNITLANATHTDNTMVYFMDDATDNFDATYDANRLVDAGNAPMLYTLAGNERLSYNALPILNAGETKTVPLSSRTNADESYTLTFNDVSTLNATVLLEDLKLNTTQPVTEGSTFTFTTTAGDSRDRFVLHFNANTVSGIASLTEANVHLFPNPTTGTATLLLNQNHGYNKAIVTDVSGRTVLTNALTEGNSHHLNTTDLPNGIYFITLTGATKQTLKLIKQ